MGRHVAGPPNRHSKGSKPDNRWNCSPQWTMVRMKPQMTAAPIKSAPISEALHPVRPMRAAVTTSQTDCGKKRDPRRGGRIHYRGGSTIDNAARLKKQSFIPRRERNGNKSVLFPIGQARGSAFQDKEH